jgi:hypothetical protein
MHFTNRGVWREGLNQEGERVYFRLARDFLSFNAPLARALSGGKANFNGSFAHFGSLVLDLGISFDCPCLTYASQIENHWKIPIGKNL